MWRRFAVALVVAGTVGCGDIYINNNTTGGNSTSSATSFGPSANPTEDPNKSPTVGQQGFRTPDPAPGIILPLPDYGAAIVSQTATANPGLVLTSCLTTNGPGAWAYLAAVVGALRQKDTRWGFLCELGNCSTISEDTISYHAIAGAEVQGVLGVYKVNVLKNHCLTAPTSQYIVLGYSTQDGWGIR